MADDGDDRSMMKDDDDSVQRIYSKRTNDRFFGLNHHLQQRCAVYTDNALP